ncbi:hypothetical protein EVAR_58875_1 [Eumeta japonica]|uniref:Uncharacterized protein n=1 Tax=Eumeta variegata TaxID=151549 RepID=A0A4C1ZBC6_EUMVA|nr:hypothetical protein EVAR_58875_1 [Eumeta japonica]
MCIGPVMTYAATVFAHTDPKTLYQLQILQKSLRRTLTQTSPYYGLKRSSNRCAPRTPGTLLGDLARAKFLRDFLCRDAHLAASIGQSRADGIPYRSATTDEVLKAPIYWGYGQQPTNMLQYEACFLICASRTHPTPAVQVQRLTEKPEDDGKQPTAESEACLSPGYTNRAGPAGGPEAVVREPVGRVIALRLLAPATQTARTPTSALKWTSASVSASAVPPHYAFCLRDDAHMLYVVFCALCALCCGPRAVRQMEAERWDLRECSVLLRRCDFAGRGSAARAEGGVPTETHEPVTAAVLREVEDGVDVRVSSSLTPLRKHYISYRDLELPIITKYMKDVSKRFFDIVGSHPNALLHAAVDYEPPLSTHFIHLTLLQLQLKALMTSTARMTDLE